MAFKFPWSNLHELNLDWILGVVKTLKESNDEFNEKADYAVQTADEAKDIAEQASQAQIADGAVTTVKIANGAVTNEKLGTGSVTSAKIQDGTIVNDDLHDSAVGTAKIADGAVTDLKLDSAIQTILTNAATLYSEATTILTDLNSLGIGRFIFGRWSSNSTQNAPTTSANFSGIVLHYASSANNQVQLALMAGQDRIYIRSCNGGTWSAWKYTTITA